MKLKIPFTEQQQQQQWEENPNWKWKWKGLHTPVIICCEWVVILHSFRPKSRCARKTLVRALWWEQTTHVSTHRTGYEMRSCKILHSSLHRLLLLILQWRSRSLGGLATSLTHSTWIAHKNPRYSCHMTSPPPPHSIALHINQMQDLKIHRWRWRMKMKMKWKMIRKTRINTTGIGSELNSSRGKFSAIKCGSDQDASSWTQHEHFLYISEMGL